MGIWGLSSRSSLQCTPFLPSANFFFGTRLSHETPRSLTHETPRQDLDYKSKQNGVRLLQGRSLGGFSSRS